MLTLSCGAHFLIWHNLSPLLYLLLFAFPEIRKVLIFLDIWLGSVENTFQELSHPHLLCFPFLIQHMCHPCSHSFRMTFNTNTICLLHAAIESTNYIFSNSILRNQRQLCWSRVSQSFSLVSLEYLVKFNLGNGFLIAI